MDDSYYAHSQNNADVVPICVTRPSFPPPYAASAPLLLLSTPIFIPQRITYNYNASNPHTLASVPHTLAHHPPVVPSPSLVQSGSQTVPTILLDSMPLQPLAPSSSQRAKFPCLFCSKLCTSRPRADTCFFNHIDAKPFACHGDCGMEDW
jgi:hypothetical protein